MAYHIHFHDRAETYLQGHQGLSEEDRSRAIDLLVDTLAEHGDTFRQQAQRRLAPESYRFRVDILLEDSDRRMWNMVAVIDDSAAEVGVLQVVYLDLQNSD